MITALVVGLGIGLLQALTQIQEQTLVFVPKIVAIFVVLLIALPFAGAGHERADDRYRRQRIARLLEPDDTSIFPRCPASSSPTCWCSRGWARW